MIIIIIINDFLSRHIRILAYNWKLFLSKTSFTWEVNTYSDDAAVIQVIFETLLLRNNIKEDNMV